MKNYIHGWRQEMAAWWQECHEYKPEKIRDGILRDLGIESYHAVRSFGEVCLIVFGITWGLFFLKEVASADGMIQEGFYQLNAFPLVIMPALTSIGHITSSLRDGLLLTAVVFWVVEAIAQIHYRWMY